MKIVRDDCTPVGIQNSHPKTLIKHLSALCEVFYQSYQYLSAFCEVLSGENIYQQLRSLISLSAKFISFSIGEKEDDPIKMYLNDIFTVPASLAGIPGISIPFGKSKEGLPLGVQLLSKHFDEQGIFNAGLYLEKNNE